MDSFSGKILYFFKKTKRLVLGIFKLLAATFFQPNIKNTSPEGINKIQLDLDKKLVLSLSNSRIPSFRQLKYIPRYFSRHELWIIYFCLAVALINTIFLSYRFYSNHLMITPVAGGEYTEGLVGSPKYVNPLYASVSDVDNDIASLVFSSLFKRDKNGGLANDLAANYQISPDGKSYAIKLNANAKWQNGNRLTADDVLFTFSAIKDPQYKSPLRQSFNGVEIEKLDDTSVKFSLTEPYAAFLDLLTFGILPQKYWQDVPPNSAGMAELNLKPIGSGSYKFKSLVKDKAGNIKSYSLILNDYYYGSKPYIGNLNFKFFGNFSESISALNNNLINGVSYLPADSKNEIVAADSLSFYNLKLPQITAIFFNQSNNQVLADNKVRQSLAYALDKNNIIDTTMGQNARLIDGPILPDNFAYDNELKKYNYNINGASQLLDEDGWKMLQLTDEDIKQAKVDLAAKDENQKQLAEIKVTLGKGSWRANNNNFLIISLTTVDESDYRSLAEQIVKYWQNLGIKTVVNYLPSNQIRNAAKQRNFSALLYSEFVGADPDPYAFWHSTQIEQGGLNITNYSNKEVDKLLEDARLTNDLNIRKNNYKKFQEIIADEIPAIFLYSQNYTYVHDKSVKGFSVTNIVSPADRFSDIGEWYVKTGNKLVWRNTKK